MFDGYREALFSKKYVHKYAKYGFASTSVSWKIVYRMETHWFSSKEKIPCTAISKKGHADSLLQPERIYHFISF